MKRFIKFFLLCTIVLLSCKQVNRNAKVAADKLEKLKANCLNSRISNHLSEFKYSDYLGRQFEHFMAKWSMTGMSVAIVKDERLVYARGFGYADRENKIKVVPGNVFRLASISKLITAVAILKLVENGKLSLGSKVFGENGILNDSIFQNPKDKRLKDITIRHVLAHSGGWSQRYGDPAFNSLSIAEKVDDVPPATIRSFYKFIAGRNLHFTPGTSSSYSNMGYMFLGEVISTISGRPYDEYIRDEILFPNGIYDMHVGASLESGRRENEVKYYEPEDSPLIPGFDGSNRLVPKVYGGNPIELLGPAGGWLASSVELARLLVLIDGNNKVKDIIPHGLLHEMVCHERTKGPLGWLRVSPDGDWWRTGSMAGTSAMMKRCKNGIGWVVLFNSSSWKGTLFANEINSIMTKVIGHVKAWPNHDLFDYHPSE
ncbi:MAG: serine hydrolase domain-containing protein [Prolixibacteraceae bacterium]|jgi:CubicO group peptidase (beta-lactamase class C family)|nr:serine hydrolase domain-containing protein [Prolixibacteraceae bacterium]